MPPLHATLALLAGTAWAQEAPADPSWLDAARTALDDRASGPERARAVDAVADSGDPEALWVLRAAAQDRLPAVQRAAIRGAAGFDEDEAVALVEWVLTDRASGWSEREMALQTLGQMARPAAGEALFAAASNRAVPARLRSESREVLSQHYPELVAERGEPGTVVDPIGGATFVLANGLAGGIVFSSIGRWGRFEGAEIVGGVGGAAAGVGTGIAYVGAHPLTSGQGLAYASGVSWGLAAGAWTTSAVHGPWAWIEDDRDRKRAGDFGAAYRLVGVGAGAAVGGWWLSREPVAWDVLEVDLAGYLGSAVVLAGTGLVVWEGTPDPVEAFYERPVYDTYDDANWVDPYDRPKARNWRERHRRDGQILAASTLVGAAAGLGVGAALQDRWELSFEDAAFASVVGLELGWAGNFTPDIFDVDDRNLKGTVRLPWNVGVIGGLVLAEAHPMPWQTTAVTASAAVSFNALGAGTATLAGAEFDGQGLAAVMVPVGLAGTTAGVVAAPWLDPGPGEWTMVAVGSALATSHGPLVGQQLNEMGSLQPDQVTGLALTAGGVATPALLTIGRYTEPRVDHWLTIGAGAGWGAGYGFLIPIAADADFSAGEQGLSTAIGTDVFALGTGLALTSGVGLEPRQTLIPQLGGVLGGSVGALGGAMAGTEPRVVVSGLLIGATAGLIGGSVLEATHPLPPVKARGRMAVGGLWLPSIHPTPDGQGTQVGVAVVGW